MDGDGDRFGTGRGGEGSCVVLSIVLGSLGWLRLEWWVWMDLERGWIWEGGGDGDGDVSIDLEGWGGRR